MATFKGVKFFFALSSYATYTNHNRLSIPMRITVLFLLTAFILISCSDDNNVPDVSNIKVDIPVERFDRDFFSLDTIGIEKGLSALYAKSPEISHIFIYRILGLSDSLQNEEVVRFIRQNKFLADSANKTFENMNDVKKDFEQAFRYVKYYYPQYRAPKLVTIVGPPDAFAKNTYGELTTSFLTDVYLGVSLQFYLGGSFSLYQDPFYVTNIAPQYRSRRFDKKYLVADAMKLIADDISPDKSLGKGLIEQMIEKGKQWWLLDKFLPTTHDSIKTGYTKNQLNWCKANEGLIWNEIITTEKDLYTKDPLTLQNYIGEAPFTQSLGPQSPGNIGQWIGWRIVEKFAEKNQSMSVDGILKTDARKILGEAKYKPK